MNAESKQLTAAPGLDSMQHGECAAVADWIAGLLASPPDAETIACYRTDKGAALLDAIAETFNCHAAIARIQDITRQASPAQTAGDLSVEWARLFGGVTGPATVSLYESAYCAESGGHLFGPPVAAMDDLLRCFGISVVAGFSEPSDHISLELAVFANLLRGADTDHAALLYARLFQWTPTFVASCQEQNAQGFYAAVAELLQALLTSPRLNHLNSLAKTG